MNADKRESEDDCICGDPPLSAASVLVLTFALLLILALPLYSKYL